MLNVGQIEEGFVLDHIKAGMSLEIYHQLQLDKLDCTVAIIKNARSNKMGKKDILKVECDINTLNLDILGFIDHNITVNVIKDGNIVEKSDVIATGMTLELISKRDASIKKDTVTVVVKGDVNGDGLVNDDDFNKSIDMCLKNTSYSETEKAYFDANDVDGDGVLDGLDLFYISNMRYGN